MPIDAQDRQTYSGGNIRTSPVSCKILLSSYGGKRQKGNNGFGWELHDGMLISIDRNWLECLDQLDFEIMRTEWKSWR